MTETKRIMELSAELLEAEAELSDLLAFRKEAQPQKTRQLDRWIKLLDRKVESLRTKRNLLIWKEERPKTETEDQTKHYLYI